MVGEEEKGVEPMELSRRTVAALELPPFAVNPLVATSCLSCVI